MRNWATLSKPPRVAVQALAGPGKQAHRPAAGNPAWSRLAVDTHASLPAQAHSVAAAGINGAGGALPHRDAIQRSFGRYGIADVTAHTDAKAAQAAQAMEASAYATGNHVAFADPLPSLRTAAHEAAHVVQQRAGVRLDGGVGAVGDVYERHADTVADRVVAGQSAEGLLARMAPHAAVGRDAAQLVQFEKPAKAKAGVAQAAADASTKFSAIATVIAGVAKIDESLITSGKQIRLTICGPDEFLVAWQNYVDRENRSGARMDAGLNGFVDPTYPGGKMGFVLRSAGVGTAIHESIHQYADAKFSAATVGEAVNEGTTELFTRVVIGYAGGKIERTVYEEQKNAMLRLQGICGLAALAQWFFKGDRSAVEKAVGPKLGQFMEWMRQNDPASAVKVL